MWESNEQSESPSELWTVERKCAVSGPELSDGPTKLAACANAIAPQVDLSVHWLRREPILLFWPDAMCCRWMASAMKSPPTFAAWEWARCESNSVVQLVLVEMLWVSPQIAE